MTVSVEQVARKVTARFGRKQRLYGPPKSGLERKWLDLARVAIGTVLGQYDLFTIGLLVRLTPKHDIYGCWVGSGVTFDP